MHRILEFDTKKNRQKFIDDMKSRHPQKIFTKFEHKGKFYTLFKPPAWRPGRLEKTIRRGMRGEE